MYLTFYNIASPEQVDHLSPPPLSPPPISVPQSLVARVEGSTIKSYAKAIATTTTTICISIKQQGVDLPLVT